MKAINWSQLPFRLHGIAKLLGRERTLIQAERLLIDGSITNRQGLARMFLQYALAEIAFKQSLRDDYFEVNLQARLMLASFAIRVIALNGLMVRCQPTSGN
ncbi:MAG: hypothetical protein Q7U28_09290 [Aquabacterium sp.]|nr:hypothetical protein [Aquabacterium sp.]